MAVVLFHSAEAWLITSTISSRLLLLGAVRLCFICNRGHTFSNIPLWVVASKTPGFPDLGVSLVLLGELEMLACCYISPLSLSDSR
jgi:hypothetical protein